MTYPALLHGWSSELRVALDLCSRGYEIYFGFGHTSCDIIALKDDRLIRVQVKTACMRDGKPSKTYTLDLSKADLLALWLPDDIRYVGVHP